MLLRTFFISVIFLGYMIFYADSRGVLTIRLLNFENKKGRTYDGSCCDQTSLDGATCPDQCDYVMRLIVSGLGRANDHVFLFHRPLKYDANDISFQEEATDMVLTILFDEWPKNGHVKMNAFFYDYDDYDHNTLLVDWFENELTRTVNKGNYQRSVVKGNRQSDKTSLEFEWSVHCFTANDCLKPPPEWKSWPWDRKEEQTVSGISIPKSTSEKTPTPTTTMEHSADVVAHQWNNGEWKKTSVAPGKPIIVDSPAIGADRSKKYHKSSKTKGNNYSGKSSSGKTVGSASHRTSVPSQNRNVQPGSSRRMHSPKSEVTRNLAGNHKIFVESPDRASVADDKLATVKHSSGKIPSSHVKGSTKVKQTSGKNDQRGQSPFRGKHTKTINGRKSTSYGDSSIRKNGFGFRRTVHQTSSPSSGQRALQQSTPSAVLLQTSANPYVSNIRSIATTKPVRIVTVSTAKKGVSKRKPQQTKSVRRNPFTPAVTSVARSGFDATTSSPSIGRKPDYNKRKWLSQSTELTLTKTYNTIPTPRSPFSKQSKRTHKTWNSKSTQYSLSTRMNIKTTTNTKIKPTASVSTGRSSSSGKVPARRPSDQTRKRFGGTLKSRYQLMNEDKDSNAKPLSRFPSVKPFTRGQKANDKLTTQKAKTHNKLLSAGKISKERKPINKKNDVTTRPFLPWSRSTSTSTLPTLPAVTLAKHQTRFSSERKRYKQTYTSVEHSFKSVSTKPPTISINSRFQKTNKVRSQTQIATSQSPDGSKSRLKPVTQASLKSSAKTRVVPAPPSMKSPFKPAQIRNGKSQKKNSEKYLKVTTEPTSFKETLKKTIPSTHQQSFSISTPSLTVKSPFESRKPKKNFDLQNNMIKELKHAVQDNIRKYVSAITTPYDVTTNINAKATSINSYHVSATSRKEALGNVITTQRRRPPTTTPAGPAWTHFTRWWQRPKTTPSLPTLKVIPAGANEGKVFNIVDEFKRRKDSKRIQGKHRSPFNKNSKKSKVLKNLDQPGSKVNPYKNINSSTGRFTSRNHPTTRSTRRASPYRHPTTTNKHDKSTRWGRWTSVTVEYGISTSVPQVMKPDPTTAIPKHNHITEKQRSKVLSNGKTSKGSKPMTSQKFEKTTKRRAWNPYAENKGRTTTPSYTTWQKVSTSHHRTTSRRGWRPKIRKTTNAQYKNAGNVPNITPVQYSTTSIPRTKTWGGRRTMPKKQTTESTKDNRKVKPNLKYVTRPNYPRTSKWGKWKPQTAKVTESSVTLSAKYYTKPTKERITVKLNHGMTKQSRLSSPPPKTTKRWRYVTHEKNVSPAKTSNIWQGLMSTRIVTNRRKIDMGTQPTKDTPIHLKKLPRMKNWNEGQSKKDKKLVQMSKPDLQGAPKLQNSNRRISLPTRNTVTHQVQTKVPNVATSRVETDIQKLVTPRVLTDTPTAVTRWWQRRRSPAAQQTERTAKATIDNSKVTQPPPSIRPTRWWERKSRKVTTDTTTSTRTTERNRGRKPSTHVPKPTRWWQRKKLTSQLPQSTSTTSRASKRLTTPTITVVTRQWQRRKEQTTIPTLAKNRHTDLLTTKRFSKSDSNNFRPTRWWQRPTTSISTTASSYPDRKSEGVTRGIPTQTRTRSWIRRKFSLTSSSTVSPRSTQSLKRYTMPTSVKHTVKPVPRPFQRESSTIQENVHKVISKETSGLKTFGKQTTINPVSEKSVTRWWQRRRHTFTKEAKKISTVTNRPTTSATNLRQSKTGGVTRWWDKYRTTSARTQMSSDSKDKKVFKNSDTVTEATVFSKFPMPDVKRNQDTATLGTVEPSTKTKSWNIFEFLPDVLNKMYSGKSVHEKEETESKISITSAAASRTPSPKSIHKTVTVNSRYHTTTIKPSTSKFAKSLTTVKYPEQTTLLKSWRTSKIFKTMMSAVTVPSKQKTKKITWLPTTKVYNRDIKKTIKKHSNSMSTTTVSTKLKNTFGVKTRTTESKTRGDRMRTTPPRWRQNKRVTTRLNVGTSSLPGKSEINIASNTRLAPTTVQMGTQRHRISLTDTRNKLKANKVSSQRSKTVTQATQKRTSLSNILRTTTTPGNDAESSQDKKSKLNAVRTIKDKRNKNVKTAKTVTKKTSTTMRTVRKRTTTTKKPMKTTIKPKSTIKKPTTTIVTPKIVKINANNNVKKSNKDDIGSKKNINSSTKKSGKSTDTKKVGISTDTKKSGKTFDTKKSGKSTDTKKSGKSTDTKKSEKSIDMKKAGKSIDMKKSGKSIDMKKSGKSTDTKKLGISIDMKKAGKNTDTKKSGKNTDMKKSGKSNGTKKVGISIGMKKLGKSLDIKKSGKSISTKKSGKSTEAKKDGIKKTNMQKPTIKTKTNGIKDTKKNDNKMQLNSVNIAPKPTVIAVNSSSERGPRVNVPNDGLFVPGPGPTKIVKIVTAQRDENGTVREEEVFVAIPSNSEAQHIGLQVKRLNIQTVFNRYWPAILGLTIGTAFLVAAVLTSVACRAQRLYIQRYRYNDQPQHLTEPPDTSEYSSSAASLVSDATRSSIRL